MITIAERDFDSFFEAPFQCYSPDSLYVSPMKSDLQRFLKARTNPLFASDRDFTYFTARRGDRIAGRITAHVHRASNVKYGLQRAYFGYFDCTDDDEVAAALLGAAERWARDNGFTEIAGNFNLNAMQQIGVMTGNFERLPYTDLVYSPEHVHRLLERNGYQRFFPMTTFENDLSTTDPAPLFGERQKEMMRSGEFTWAPITQRTLKARLEEARVILNDSFANNAMFVPVSKEEFDFQVKEMAWIMDPRISAILHHKNEPAATIICIPDLNPLLKATRSRMGLTTPWHFLKHRLNRRRAVLIYSAVRSRFQGQGVNPLVLHRVLTAMKAAGYQTLGGTWISDENKASLRQKEKMGAEPLHRLHLYRKSLAA
jgi:GNAT superfamily N-acetyltransferase